MSLKRLDVAALYRDLNLIRQHGRMSWRDLAKATGCSPSLFSRLAEGRSPDADALCTLIDWLCMPLEHYTIDAPDPES
jgi:transcriptional regulator with XRE-family HTH domain